MIRLVIFDFDGTIADSFDMVIDIGYGLVKKLGYKISREAIVEEVKNTPLNLIFEKYRIGFLRRLLIRNYILFYYWLYRNKVSFKKDVREVCEGLHERGIKFGIVSSTPSFIIKSVLSNHNCTYFDFVKSGSWFGKGKVILKVIEKYKVDKGDVIYVGDEVRDVLTCRAIGIKCVSVVGFNSYGLLKEYNELVVRDLKGALELLEKF